MAKRLSFNLIVVIVLYFAQNQLGLRGKLLKGLLFYGRLFVLLFLLFHLSLYYFVVPVHNSLMLYKLQQGVVESPERVLLFRFLRIDFGLGFVTENSFFEKVGVVVTIGFMLVEVVRISVVLALGRLGVDSFGLQPGKGSSRMIIAHKNNKVPTSFRRFCLQLQAIREAMNIIRISEQSWFSHSLLSIFRPRAVCQYQEATDRSPIRLALQKYSPFPFAPFPSLRLSFSPASLHRISALPPSGNPPSLFCYPACYMAQTHHPTGCDSESLRISPKLCFWGSLWISLQKTRFCIGETEEFPFQSFPFFVFASSGTLPVA